MTSEEHIKKSQKVEDGAIDWKLYAEEIEQRLETKSSEEKKRGEAEAENTECQLWAELSHARAKLGQWHEALSAARKAGRSTFEGRRAEVKALLGLGRCGEALTVARDAVGLANDAQESEADTLLRSAMTAHYEPIVGERPVRVEYYGKRKGKGLVALRDFKQGDEIFHEEPLVCAPPFFPAQEKPLCCSNCMRYLDTREAMVDRMVAHVKQSDKAKAAALPRFDELCPPFSETEGQMCQGCGVEVYCTTQCKDDAWRRYHEAACPAYAALRPYFESEDFYDIGVMALRIYAIILQNLKAARGDSLAARLDEAYMPFMHFCKAPFSDVVCYVAGINKYQDELVERDELKKYKTVLVQQLHLSLVDALVPEELRSEEIFSWENLDLLMGMVATNVQKISSPLQRYAKTLQQQDPRTFDRSIPDELIPFINAHSGQGLFVVHNCMNHSCDNNAETTFRHGDRTATVVAVKDIRQGEEVCIDYIGAKRLRWSAPMRRRRLLREYLFECACPLCSGAAP